MDTLVIASRESRLALWQAEFVQQQLTALYPEIDISILGMTTRGDQILDKTLSKIGGKGLFVKELEQALQNGLADIAVHSLKDVPMILPEGFMLAAILKRETPFDAFVSNHYQSLTDLPHGAIVGTSSLRREAQIRAKFPHLQVRPLRGNVLTRLDKLDKGEFEAIILAAAGLIRLNLHDRISSLLDKETSLPAVGQGALAIEIASHRQDLLVLLAPLNHASTHTCVTAERAVSKMLGGSCQVPLAAFATIENNELTLQAMVASPDGQTIIHAADTAPPDQAEQLGQKVAQMLIDQGALPLIDKVLQP